ncbi:proton-conducting transporter transmembrane domain-containing protein [Quadrisphaera sp. KR29]|uniref:proton-conducting transporter transmembrane domain-containing protein n=1 Tax=Quadrisphaera sp. KR29 TaxID=3461391 RepID=UPI004044CD6C
MSGVLVLVPVVLPVVVGAVLLLRGRPAGASAADRTAALAATAVVVLAAAALLAGALQGRVAAAAAGGWPAGVSIVLAADAAAALGVLLTSALVLVSLVLLAGTREDHDPRLLPLVLLLSAGVYGALLTTDLFNLFVFVELMLVPSYVLVALGRRGAGGGRLYVTVNLLASTVFLVGVGLVYGTTGTVSLEQLRGAAADDPAVAAAAGVVLVALLVKSAAVPLHSWLPGSYSAVGPGVAVLFSGLLTKVGVLALLRVWAVVFEGRPALAWVLLAVAVATMVVGVLAAVGSTTVRTVLTNHMVSQIGYLLAGVGLASAAGYAAALFFLVQYAVVKAALLGVSAAVEVRAGTDELAGLGGLARREPVLAVGFAVAALGLVGVPPTSGFVAKLQLASAAAAGGSWWVLAAVVAVSLVTLVSMLKLWNGVFVGEGPDLGDERRLPAAVLAPVLVLAAGALVLGVWADPLLEASRVAAEQLVQGGAP